MADIIQLLPDSVANQIAAGEVIQRPASVVKELIENSLDAGADTIKILIKDAGKTLIQVIDNGKGMSATDARLSFERHATSKIRQANDLFKINTMGFRGEAMASIAAIAHIELKTKLFDSDLGTQIIIQGSEVKSQDPCQCSEGTSISVKNLFFNVPARRRFLKSDTTEFQNIIEEVYRVAIPNPDIAFYLYHNDQDLLHLNESNAKQRIEHIFSKGYSEKIFPVEEETTLVKIQGYITKPQYAKKRRGEQYFFINKRYKINTVSNKTKSIAIILNF